MNGFLSGLLLFFASHGTVSSGHSLSFEMEREGTPPTHYTIRLQQATGEGVYIAAPANAVEASAAEAAHATPIHVSEPVLAKLFATLPVVAGHRCESHSRNIAQTGKKTLRFAEDDASAECSYNYSDDDRLNAATMLLEAVAETMQIGDRLGSKLRFDRLGLDLEMSNLQIEMTEHRAIEIGNIAPVLRSIVEDDRVLERVRRKAGRLLEDAGLPSSQSAAAAGANER